MANVKKSHLIARKVGAKKVYYVDFLMDNGERHRYSTGETNQEVAFRKLKEERSRIEAGCLHSDKVIFSAYVERYLTLYSNGRSNWRQHKEYHFAPLITHFGSMLLKDITTTKIQEYCAKRCQENIKTIKAKSGKPPRTVSRSTVNKEISCLKSLFKKAIEEGIVVKNTAQPIKFYSETDKQRMRFLAADEVNALIDASTSPLKQIVTLMAHTGMRSGEVKNLKWTDVFLNDEGCRITLRNTKNGRPRVIMLNDAAKAAISSMPKASEYLFPSKDKQKPYDFRRPFQEAVVKAGLNRPGEEKVVPHTLRHFFCSTLGRAGCDFNLGMELVGHADTRSHIRYKHFYDSDRMRVLSRVQSLINGTNSGTVGQEKTLARGAGVANSMQDNGKEMRGRGLEPLTSSMSRKRSNQLN